MINERPHEEDGLYEESNWLLLSVDARVKTDGRIIPLYLEIGGHRLKIEKILDERAAMTRKRKLAGTRFIVLVQGRRLTLCHDRGCWYLDTGSSPDLGLEY